MKAKIKHVFRIGVEETNSSSSHTIVIGGKNDLIRRGDEPTLDTYIGHDNILRVPSGTDTFGWEFTKSNNPILKIQYVSALLCTDIETVKGQKRIAWFKNLIKNYLGVDDVIFEWQEEFEKQLKARGSDEFSGREELVNFITENYRPSYIDHQSFDDAWETILENKDTLTRFLFSRGSWWFGGNDNDGAPAGFYKEVLNEDNSIIGLGRVDLGGAFGVLEIPLYGKTDLMEEVYTYPPLSSIAWSPKSNQFVEIDRFSFAVGHNDNQWALNQELSYINENGIPMIVFCGGSDTNNKITALMLEKKQEAKSTNKDIDYSQGIVPPEVQAFKEGILVKDKNYKEIPVSVELYEFNKIIV